MSLLKKLLRKNKNQIAAIIVEPVGGQHGGRLKRRILFLKGLELCATKRKIVLIFDEVMTGFRVAMGGAQETIRHKT